MRLVAGRGTAAHVRNAVATVIYVPWASNLPLVYSGWGQVGFFHFVVLEFTFGTVSRLS